MGLPPTLKPPLGSAQDTVSSPGSKSLLPLAYYHAIFCTSPNSKLLSVGEAHILVISLSLHNWAHCLSYSCPYTKPVDEMGERIGQWKERGRIKQSRVKWENSKNSHLYISFKSSIY